MYNVLASEVTSTLVDNINPIMESIRGAVSVGDIVSVVGTALAFGLGFTMVWFGIRKVANIALTAIQTGRIDA